MSQISETNRGLKTWISFLLPLILLAGLLWGFIKYGPLGVFKAEFPPVEKLVIQRVNFMPERIDLEVFNDGPESVTVAQLVVNEVIWQFKMQPDNNTLKPLEGGVVSLAYPWTEGDPIAFTLISSDGVTFGKEVDVAFLTPTIDATYLRTFILLGLYVGVVPVLLGLLWFPFLRRLKGKGYLFLLSLTIGLLLFLGFSTLAESIELIGELPSAFNGVGLLVIGFVSAILILGAVTYKTEFSLANKSDHSKALIWSYLIALGIGLHNLGEGLAIGSAYTLGEIALGSTLVIGFMVHNVTEGVAIISPLTHGEVKIKRFFKHLLLMGLLAGAPTILGSLIGGFAYSPVYGVLFLAIGAGAIFDVTFDILHHMAKGRWNSLFTTTNVFGFLAGLFLMYVTGFLVLG
ncbi:MAG: putative metal cation transporter [Parcubacteria group bacterium Gr01-1014_13]|nr:MAG: putative metal cation transporter [Parcubacteria group bacterium Gr01-1014_13]